MISQESKAGGGEEGRQGYTIHLFLTGKTIWRVVRNKRIRTIVEAKVLTEKFFSGLAHAGETSRRVGGGYGFPTY